MSIKSFNQRAFLGSIKGLFINQSKDIFTLVQVTRRVFNIKTRESNPRRGDSRWFSMLIANPNCIVWNPLEPSSPGSRWWFGRCPQSIPTSPSSTSTATLRWPVIRCPMATPKLTSTFSAMVHYLAVDNILMVLVHMSHGSTKCFNFLIESCFLIALIKCLKGHKSLGPRFVCQK